MKLTATLILIAVFIWQMNVAMTKATYKENLVVHAQEVTPTLTPTPQPPAKGWEGFVQKIERLAPIYDFPVKVAVSQAALESARGNSPFAKQRRNFFGIGAYDHNPDSAFTYENEEQCIIEYMRLIKIRFNEAYQQRNNPDKMIELIKLGGYASDPNYVQKIKSLPEWSQF